MAANALVNVEVVDSVLDWVVDGKVVCGCRLDFLVELSMLLMVDVGVVNFGRPCWSK